MPWRLEWIRNDLMKGNLFQCVGCISGVPRITRKTWWVAPVHPSGFPSHTFALCIKRPTFYCYGSKKCYYIRPCISVYQESCATSFFRFNLQFCKKNGCLSLARKLLDRQLLQETCRFRLLVFVWITRTYFPGDSNSIHFSTGHDKKLSLWSDSDLIILPTF